MDQSGWALCCSSANALSQVDSVWKGAYEPSDARLSRVGPIQLETLCQTELRHVYWSKATAVYPILSDLLTLKVILLH